MVSVGAHWNGNTSMAEHGDRNIVARAPRLDYTSLVREMDGEYGGV